MPAISSAVTTISSLGSSVTASSVTGSGDGVGCASVPLRIASTGTGTAAANGDPEPDTAGFALTTIVSSTGASLGFCTVGCCGGVGAVDRPLVKPEVAP